MQIANEIQMTMVGPDDILSTQNQEWGFWGTTSNWGEDENLDESMIEAEWVSAFAVVAATNPRWSAEDIRTFLDSRYGRHFADAAFCADGVCNIKISQWTETFRMFEKLEK